MQIFSLACKLQALPSHGYSPRKHTHTFTCIIYLDYRKNIRDSQYLVPLKTVTQETFSVVFFIEAGRPEIVKMRSV